MKMLQNTRITHALAAAALAGMSFTSAFAITYVPPANSPLDTTTLDSNSALLDAFNGYLGNIQTALTAAVPTATLRTPDLGGGVAPTDVQFYAAVNAAILADGSHAYEIAAAAIQYKPAKIANIVLEVSKANPLKAADAVRAGAAVLPLKAPDAAGSAIKGLLLAAANNSAADMAAASDDAITADTKALFEKVAKTAVSATKGGSSNIGTQAARATAVANAMVDAVVAVAASTNARLYLDDVARGGVAGAKGFANITRAQVAAGMLQRLALTPLANEKDVSNFVAGALQSADPVDKDAGAGFYPNVLSALLATGVGTTYTGAVNTVATMNLAARNAVSGTEASSFQTAMGPAEFAHVYAAVSGATQYSKGSAAAFVNAAYTDADAGVLSLADKKDIIAAAVTSNSSAEAKIVLSAVAAVGVNTISAVDAVTAAIPAGTEIFAASSLTGLVKLHTANAGEAQAILHAANVAATAAGYQKAYGDIALLAVKGNKAYGDALIATSIADVASGWEENVAANIAANDPANAVLLTAAQAAATTKNGAPLSASVTLAIQYAQAAKGKGTLATTVSTKTIFDDAVAHLIANPNEARAAIFGAGAANPKLAIELLAVAMRNNKDNVNTGPSNAQLLTYATALTKVAAPTIKIAYDAVVDALDSVGNLSDMLDHKLLTNPAAAFEIATATAAARPEFAHYVARIAGFRAPKLAAKIGQSIITFSQMRKTDANNPAAVAAISEGYVLGVLDAKLSALDTAKYVAAAVGGIVKGVRTFSQFTDKLDPDFKSGLVGSSATFAEANGALATIAGGTTLRRAKGTAAAVTGAVAGLQGPGAAAANFSDLAFAAVKGAVAASKDHVFAIAQAAAQAAGFVAILEGQTFGDNADVARIVAAIVAGFPTANAVQTENAVRVGLAQVALGNAGVGAGAAGTTNTATFYAHHSGLSTGINAPVTDVGNF